MIIRAGGVPEHFNLPWLLAIEEHADPAVEYRWTDFPGGTGEMCTALRSGEIDIALVLTEGILRDIEQGNTARILGVYVSSPLIWGVHVNNNSPYNETASLVGKNAAISRFGSGSHLMVKVLAREQKWPDESLSFVVVGDLQGGVLALMKGDADYFLWEKFMTKTYVDNNILRRIGECRTPWPCFLIAVSEKAWQHKQQEISRLLSRVQEKAAWVKTAEGALNMLAERYMLDKEDVREWRSGTSWFGMEWTAGTEQEIRSRLKDFGII